jgi:hypothetical protein
MIRRPAEAALRSEASRRRGSSCIEAARRLYSAAPQFAPSRLLDCRFESRASTHHPERFIHAVSCRALAVLSRLWACGTPLQRWPVRRVTCGRSGWAAKKHHFRCPSAPATHHDNAHDVGAHGRRRESPAAVRRGAKSALRHALVLDRRDGTESRVSAFARCAGTCCVAA